MNPIKRGKTSSGLIGKAQLLATLAKYQTGSIVSREIISRKAGTVTIFAFDQGQGLSEHTAPFDALILIIDGQAEITISGRGQTLNAGEMIIMPAGKPHALQADRKFKMVLVMIRS